MNKTHKAMIACLLLLSSLTAFGQTSLGNLKTNLATPTNSFENGGFETGDLSGWNVAGSAFSNTDVTSDNSWADGSEFLFVDNYHLWGGKSGDNTDIGEISSGSFTIGGDGRISFRIAGGNDSDNLYLALIKTADGQELFRATGRNNERYSPLVWNAEQYIGEEVYFKAVDNATNDWGHLNLDDLRIPTDNNLAATAPYDSTLYDESRRNQYHFSSPQGWHNDVNGPVYYNGEFHLFYQHNPTKTTYYNWTAPMHWGHAVSTDLMHWKIKPIGLDPNTSNVNRLYSGGGIVDTNNTSGLKTGEYDVIGLFTGIDNGISMCYSVDGGVSFQDYNSISVPYTNVSERRDPKVFWFAPSNKWIMVIYEERTDVGRSASFYSSANLINWSYESSYVNNLYECPDMYQLEILNPDGSGSGVYKWILSDADFDYEVGDFDGHTFTSNMGTSKFRMEYAPTQFNNTYASLTYENVLGRRIQQSWMGRNDGGSEGKWDGCMSFPLELNLVDYGVNDIRIVRKPVAEIENLYTESLSWTNQTITAGSNLLKDTYGLHYELIAEFDLNGCTADSFGLQLRNISDTPSASVIYDKNAQKLNGFSMAPTADNKIKIQVLIDQDAFEYFGNDGYISYQGNQYFEASAFNQKMAVVATGGSVTLTSLKLNRLDRIWQGEVTWPIPDTDPDNYPTIIENTDCTYSGNWTEHQDSVYHGGSCNYGNDLGGYFEASFTGNEIQWYGLKNTDLGYADVYLDGNLVADDIDCYSPDRDVHILFEATNLVTDLHTIRVVVDGKKNPASANTYLVHDYFEYELYKTPEDPTALKLGINFASDQGPSPMSGIFFDGVTNWTDTTGANGGPLTVLGSGGNVSVNWSASNVWYHGNDNTPEDTLYYGYLDDLGDGCSVSLAGLNTWLLNEDMLGYKLRIYRNTDLGTGFNDIEVLSDDSIIDTIEFTGSLPSNSYQEVNESTILVADAITIKPVGTDGSGSISAVQIMAIPEPVTFFMLALAGLALIRR